MVQAPCSPRSNFAFNQLFSQTERVKASVCLHTKYFHLFIRPFACLVSRLHFTVLLFTLRDRSLGHLFIYFFHYIFSRLLSFLCLRFSSLFRFRCGESLRAWIFARCILFMHGCQQQKLKQMCDKWVCSCRHPLCASKRNGNCTT